MLELDDVLKLVLLLVEEFVEREVLVEFVDEVELDVVLWLVLLLVEELVDVVGSHAGVSVRLLNSKPSYHTPAPDLKSMRSLTPDAVYPTVWLTLKAAHPVVGHTTSPVCDRGILL